MKWNSLLRPTFAHPAKETNMRPIDIIHQLGLQHILPTTDVVDVQVSWGLGSPIRCFIRTEHERLAYERVSEPARWIRVQWVERDQALAFINNSPWRIVATNNGTAIKVEIFETLNDTLQCVGSVALADNVNENPLIEAINVALKSPRIPAGLHTLMWWKQTIDSMLKLHSPSTQLRCDSDAEIVP